MSPIPLGVLASARRASSWTPASLGGALAAWWDASAITGLSDGSAVSSWSDLSGNARTLTTDPGGGAATYKTSIRNSLPVVRFDGSNDCLHATGVINADSTYEMVIVLAVTGAAGAIGVPLANQRSSPSPFVGGTMIRSTANVRGLYSPGAYATYAGGTYTAGTWERWNLTSAAALYVNGSSMQTGAALAAGADIRVGAARRTMSSTLEFFTPMDVAEIIISTDVLSPGDRAALDAYLATKWGF